MILKDTTVKHKYYGFTMIELLTVLAIIMMLVGLLIPAVTMVRNTARQAKQGAQLTTIDNALLTFRNDYGDYPPSNLTGTTPNIYCGAQKLAEALLGRDLLGFHPLTNWDPIDPQFYPPYPPGPTEAELRLRRARYLELGTNSAFKLGNASGDGLFNNTGPTLNPDRFVICDTFGVRRINFGKGNTVTAGSPILYYKANISSKTMDYSTAGMNNCIYNAYDNLSLLALNRLTPDGKPYTGLPHQLDGGYTNPTDGSGEYFYSTNYKIIDQKITTRLWPHRPDSYILISAGLDGEYGTGDDIFNF